jgi:hypothetical protein
MIKAKVCAQWTRRRSCLVGGQRQPGREFIAWHGRETGTCRTCRQRFKEYKARQKARREQGECDSEPQPGYLTHAYGREICLACPLPECVHVDKSLGLELCPLETGVRG